MNCKYKANWKVHGDYKNKWEYSFHAWRSQTWKDTNYAASCYFNICYLKSLKMVNLNSNWPKSNKNEGHFTAESIPNITNIVKNRIAHIGAPGKVVTLK